MHKLKKELSQNKTKECVFVGIHMFFRPDSEPPGEG